MVFPPSEQDSPTRKHRMSGEGLTNIEGEMGEDEMDVSTYPTGV
jgi:hypothetical protein